MSQADIGLDLRCRGATPTRGAHDDHIPAAPKIADSALRCFAPARWRRCADMRARVGTESSLESPTMVQQRLPQRRNASISAIYGCESGWPTERLDGETPGLGWVLRRVFGAHLLRYGQSGRTPHFKPGVFDVHLRAEHLRQLLDGRDLD